MSLERICNFMIQNEDGEDWIEVRHTATQYLMMRAVDGSGRELFSIDLDYEEAEAVAFALNCLLEWHGPKSAP